MRLSYALCVIAMTMDYILADTEIRNIHLPLQITALPPALPSNTSLRVDHRIHQLELSVSAVKPDQYVYLDFDEGLEDWTVRISWPGSSPTKFDLNIHPILTEDRQALLHIHASALSPRFPHPLIAQLRTLLSTNSLPSLLQTSLLSPAPPPDPADPAVLPASASDKGFETNFHLVLEPLLHGILPQTAQPLLYWILGAVILGSIFTPFVIWFNEMNAGIANLRGGDSSLDSPERPKVKAE